MDSTTPRSIFATFEENPGYATFKTAVDALPDVLGYLQEIRTHTPVSHTLDLSPKKTTGGREKSQQTLRNYGLHNRFQYRPDTAPGVGAAVTLRSTSPSVRFQPRREDNIPMTPGPQSYNAVKADRPLLGIICREPKFKDRKSEDFHSLGPGSYEISLSPHGHSGYRFGKDLLDQPGVPDVQPGPGYYTRQDSPGGMHFSIGKARAMPTLVVSQRLGPGCYNNSPRRSEGGAGRFSSAARFAGSGVAGKGYAEYVPRFRVMSKQEREAQRRRIEANKDLDGFRTEVKKELIAKKSAQKAVKIEITRMAKSGLLQSIKSRRQQALEDKFRRFEWRMHRNEVSELQRSWCALALLFSSFTTFSVKFTYRKELHIRSRQALLFLTVMCVCVGVILVKVKRMRVRKSLVVRFIQTLKKLLPFAKKWLAHRRQHFTSLIVHLAEKAMTQDVMFQLMVRWLRKLEKVQKAGRTFLRRQRLLYVKAKMGWALTEVSMHKSAAKRITFTTEVLEGKASIPDRVKEYYIRIFLQKKMMKYFEELKLHKETCDTLLRRHHTHLYDFQAEQILKGEVSASVDGPELPPAPELSLHLTKDDFKAIIIEAEKNRLNWDKLLQQDAATEKRKVVRKASRNDTAHPERSLTR